MNKLEEKAIFFIPVGHEFGVPEDNAVQLVLDDLAAAGCFAVFLGTESMDDAVLQSMNKRVTAEQSRFALKLAMVAPEIRTVG